MLSIRDLSVLYGSIKVLDRINMEIVDEKIAIIGPNGSGKTTLLKSISGLISDFSGDIIYDGQSIKASKNMPGLGINLPDVFRVLDADARVLIKIYAQAVGVEEDRIMHDMVRFGLDRAMNRKMREMSEGQKKIFCNIMALHLGYRIALLDEPFESLDQRSKGLLAEIIGDRREPVMIITHEIGMLRKIRHLKLFFMFNGRLFGSAPADLIEELYIDPDPSGRVLFQIDSGDRTFYVKIGSGKVKLSAAGSMDLVSEVLYD
ncbi:ABC transporter ATP-binding protein [Thermoplasma sp.]|uniref:ABC transporter ATP-binding protein n=1 Tax=Thermoplasma sp. TaxID=1973142 RepID=UPI00260ED55C|nr:ABC transporter ATP-binding protein [Thermoplasma sp.]